MTTDEEWRRAVSQKLKEAVGFAQEDIHELPAMQDADPVNHPAHYTAYPVEVIELTEHLNFCRGNAVKYIARAGLKSKDTEIEDLQKAAWYLDREIERLKKE